jgi:hypothetical protein
MSAAYNGAAAGAAAAAAIANATKATGAIVKLTPEEFAKILARIEEPIIVQGKGGFLYRKFQYLTNYKGLFFFTQSAEPLKLPYKAELIAASNIWVPQ